MVRLSMSAEVHQFLSATIKPGDSVIDATLGNGHDTLFLAEHVGEEGHVFGFDIQAGAVNNSLKQLVTHQLDHRATLMMKSHVYMADLIPEQFHGHIKCVMFNLGYLPGSDKSVITLPESTLSALNIALNLLAEDGIISILAYSGHPGGADECSAVKAWASQLPRDGYRASVIDLLSSHRSPPEWILISRTQML
ncbi:MAG: methyltransferase domain-containing protein [Mariprofundaceae bacterium]|nr:methyltransferase domain-containing protein [Mariprofundaceae bacterium]